MKPRMYLAGPITGLTYDHGQDWRELVSSLMPEVQTLSPLRGKEYLRAHGVLESSYLEVHPLSTAKGITARDRNDVKTSHLVFANFLGAERVSIGTMIELGWADAFRVPVVAVMEEDNVHRHAMAEQIAGWVVDDIDTAVFEVAKTILAV